jgi:uncharacterized protein (DUF1800 family)
MLPILEPADWNRAKAGQLLQRAGFGGTPAQVDALASLSPQQAARSLFDSAPPSKIEPPPSILLPTLGDKMRTERNRLKLMDPKTRAQKNQEINRAIRAEREKRLTELRGWWLNRMADPLTAAHEKIVLFLHGHFATSEEKVKNPQLLWLQNQMFRQKALGSWSDLVLGVAKDPAMLIYLDGARSKSQQPNENFARELFELFTLGEGNYTEKDIQESARAFTGWSIRLRNKPGEMMDEETHLPSFLNNPRWHDGKSKKIFGQTGNFDGNDVVRLALQQPAAARWITGKLWKFYAGTTPTEDLHAELVAEWKESGQSIRPFLEAMWTHPAFYAPELARQRVKSPVEWLVGLCRQLNRPLPAPALSSEILAQLGQKLFAPPNVKGWDGGITWINTASLQKRYQYAGWVVSGTQGMKELAGMDLGRMAVQSGLVEVPTPMIGEEMADEPNLRKELAQKRRAAATQARELFALPPVPVDEIASPEQRQNPDELVAALARRLLLGDPVPPELLGRFRKAAGRASPVPESDVREVLLAIVQSPVYQVG